MANSLKDMSNNVIDKIDYTVFCMNEFARSNSLSYHEAFDYLDKYQAIDYITDFMLRTLSSLWVWCCRIWQSAAVQEEVRWYDIPLSWYRYRNNCATSWQGTQGNWFSVAEKEYLTIKEAMRIVYPEFGSWVLRITVWDTQIGLIPVLRFITFHEINK